MKILVIEDEMSLLDAIKIRLIKEKYDVDTCIDGKEGYFMIISNIYDLIILDVMLPSMNGFEVLNELKNKNIKSKIIMLTARSSIEDKLEGLENGANDYITKPFHMDELVARINIQLKNNLKYITTYKDLELNKSTSTLKCTNTNEKVELVCKELKLLQYFMNNPKIILSKEQIYDEVWGCENETESNNLEAYLSFIRKKIKAIGSVVTIKSVRGLGYKMED